jgi:hypothetical protein
MTVQISGTPNPQALAVLYETVAKWIEDGCPCYQCQECFSPLNTAEERDAHFCTRHLATRHVYTYEEALESIRRGNERRAKRQARAGAGKP